MIEPCDQAWSSAIGNRMMKIRFGHLFLFCLLALSAELGYSQNTVPETVFAESQSAVSNTEAPGIVPVPEAPVAETTPVEPEVAPVPAPQPAPPPASIWKGIPPIFVFPRPGEFMVFPTDCGYYSLIDAFQGNCREKPPVMPYGRISFKPYPFYDADFSYLDNPKNQQCDWSDCLKRRELGCNWLLTTGGEIRNRYMAETNSRLTGNQNTYDLLRTMVYGSLWYQDIFGVYAQGIDAHSFSQELTPLGIDVNRTDFVDLFVDLKLFEIDEAPVYVRGGRQELSLGSQRLVSNLDWANTLRTFQGVRMFRNTEKMDVSLFWVQPIIIDPSNFDSPNEDQNLTGIWTTFRPKKGHFIDVYALNLDRATPLVPGNGGALGHSNITTIGGRYAGDHNNWLWDFEQMLQFGANSNQNLFAGASSNGVGYHFADRSWKPQMWFTYDYASGDGNPGAGNSFNTFNQLFPFGHYYLGYLDLVGRQNIHDFHTQFVMFPTNYITFLTQFHHYRLDSPYSPLYNAAGAAIRSDATGASGVDVGNEIDFVTNFHIGPHQDVLIGYSKLFAGNFIKNTGNGSSPELFYLQHQFRF